MRNCCCRLCRLHQDLGKITEIFDKPPTKLSPDQQKKLDTIIQEAFAKATGKKP